VKVVLLRGGAARRARRLHHEERVDSGDCGVTAVGSGGRWALINVSAAVARQFGDDGLMPALPGASDGDVRAIVLTDAQLEHAAGLLGLRRGPPLDLYATPAVFEELSVHLPVLPALQHYCGVHWRVVPVAGDRRSASFRIESLPMLEFTAFATAVRPWPHAQSQRALVGDNIAVAVRDLVTGASVFCAPGLTRPGPEELATLQRSDCVLLDELADPTGRDAPWLDWLQQLPARRKVVLSDLDARDARALARRGIEVARDGMEIDL
jgi:pyrroloquinoline quinone biosynthesis protein B